MFKEVMPLEQAVSEVKSYLAARKMFPSRVEALKPMIDTVAEAMMYGFVAIDDDGVITQMLVDPIQDVNGAVVLDKLVYRKRVKPDEVNREIEKLKEDNQRTRIMMYVTLHCEQPKAIINKLETQDRAVCDAIGFFLI